MRFLIPFHFIRNDNLNLEERRWSWAETAQLQRRLKQGRLSFRYVVRNLKMGICHPQFISGSDIQCEKILKQVQDDEV